MRYSYLKKSYAPSFPDEGWQLYAGWKTGKIGTRQTRRPPAHSRHDTDVQTQKSASSLIDGGAYAPIFCSTGFQARSLDWQRQVKGSARSEELQCDWQGVFKSKNFNRHKEL